MRSLRGMGKWLCFSECVCVLRECLFLYMCVCVCVGVYVNVGVHAFFGRLEGESLSYLIFIADSGND